jgi:tryptophan-rich sensory protein
MFSNAVQSTPKLAATESIVIAAPKDYRWVRIACLITLVSCGELAALATVLYFRPTLGSQHLQMPVIFVLGSLSMVVNAFKGWVAGGVINLHRFSKRGVRALTAFAVNTLASWIHVPVSVGVQSAVLRMSFELFVAATALRMIYLFYRVDKRTLFWLVPLLIWLPLTLYFSCTLLCACARARARVE